MLNAYISQIVNSYNRGDAREETYYSHLKELLEAYAYTFAKRKIHVTVLPKSTEAGNPDFRIWNGHSAITGYIEAKDLDKNLDHIEGTEQLQRYLTTFPNVILTNFTEFRLYRNGELIDKVSITRPLVLMRVRTAPPIENSNKFYALMDMFFSFTMPHIRTAKSLAKELAKRTRFLRDEVVTIEMEEEGKKGRKALLGFYEAFKKYLIGTLNEKQFADLYAQTLTYGLFASRTRSNDEFNRELAYKYIPQTIGILRDVFRYISLEEPPKALQIIVDDIAEVLRVTDVKKILHDYFVEKKGRDPIVHFYETFLAYYDPETRERRGVYYTPEPVVSYIVRAIHFILKTHFNLPDGLASKGVTVLDPAGGTLTFPAEAIKLAVEEYTVKYGSGSTYNLIKEHVLPNFYAFELMMAPYAIGHLKMSFLFEELGYRLGDDERFNLYLTNTLEMAELSQTEIPGLGSLSEESQLAGKVKKQEPVLVVFGNPPYSGMSANNNDWTERLLKEDIDGAQSYYTVDGLPLGEKNSKWLQDDYVKFLRFAQWKIHKTGHGVVGMITNHSYLDNPTFRGMRQSLMSTFNEIYILDLHGNTLKRETDPAGGKDENVFDIRQGVAIAIFVKIKDKSGCEVYHSDQFGLRENKYEWLDTNDFSINNYDTISPKPPYYFFIKRNTEHIQNYLKWPKINEIFPLNSVGIVTARDRLTIHFSENAIWRAVNNFSRLDTEMARHVYLLGKDARDWKVSLAQKDLRDSGPDRKNIAPILYRPFDLRYTYYTGRSRGFHCMPRPDTMRLMRERNLGLTVGRQGQVVGLDQQWSLVLISENIIDFNLYYRGGELLLPLYIYPNKESRDLFNHAQIEKEPNIPQFLFHELSSFYDRTPTPEEILYYIYGVFYSSIYRKKYAEFLRIDFPRVPFTKNYDLFTRLGELGNELADLHLLKSSALDIPVTRYQGDGINDLIGKIIYQEDEQRIYINTDKYFEGVTPEVWQYHIGGYQVLQKYLKDRRGRLMNEAPRYCRIVTAISKTIELQKMIDELYLLVDEEMEVRSRK